ncbi:MAG: DKNYY domain-containing protein [Spirochaetes bacterium]|nr:DKNYY domain-containing protein [Spirochaetota bacterium]
MNYFKVLAKGYALDHRFVYLNGIIMDKAEPSTFRLIEIPEKYLSVRQDLMLSTDKKYVFHYYKRLGTKPDKFNLEKFIIKLDKKNEKMRSRMNELNKKGKITY